MYIMRLFKTLKYILAYCSIHIILHLSEMLTKYTPELLQIFISRSARSAKTPIPPDKQKLHLSRITLNVIVHAAVLYRKMYIQMMEIVIICITSHQPIPFTYIHPSSMDTYPATSLCTLYFPAPCTNPHPVISSSICLFSVQPCYIGIYSIIKILSPILLISLLNTN